MLFIKGTESSSNLVANFPALIQITHNFIKLIDVLDEEFIKMANHFRIIDMNHVVINVELNIR